MDFAAEKLFNYLRDTIYDPDNAALDIEELPEDFQDLGKGIKYYTECVAETNMLAKSLSKGILTDNIPSYNNELAAPLKSLHASLKHLTWQTQQIANGDYKQRVDFMGEFSDAFNMMVEQLAERQCKLEDKIKQIKKKTTSLKESNLLLTALMHYIPQQIIVINRDTREVLFMNDIALNETNNDANYLENILQIMSGHKDLNNGCEISFSYMQGKLRRYFIAKTYFLEWNNSNAEVFSINDVSATKNKIDELETQAYRDSITQLYNRTFGMMTLDSWLYEKRNFVLIFADLDCLKYINDEFGHNEGDIYIINAAKHLKTFSSDAVVCRIGGDEYMLLVPDTTYDKAENRMHEVFLNFQNDEHLKDKTFSYSISYGVVGVEKENKLSASDILSVADERMYENKRTRKKNRQT